MATELAAILELLRERLPAATEQPLLLDTAQAVAHVGVSRSAFFRLVAAGSIAAVHVPGSVPLYRRQDLERFTEKLKPSRRRKKVAVVTEEQGRQNAA